MKPCHSFALLLDRKPVKAYQSVRRVNVLFHLTETIINYGNYVYCGGSKIRRITGNTRALLQSRNRTRFSEYTYTYKVHITCMLSGGGKWKCHQHASSCIIFVCNSYSLSDGQRSTHTE